MRALWETGETLACALRDAPGVPVLEAFACAASEREIDPTVMATTAPAVRILLLRTRCSLPVRIYPPVLRATKSPGWLDAVPTEPRHHNV
jgi:hypothetical protein